MFRNHPFLQQRNAGDTKKFRGNILCWLVFLNLPNQRWSDTEKTAFTATFRKAMQLAKTEADHMNVPLQFTIHTDDFSSTAALPYEAVDSMVEQEYISQKGAGWSGIYKARLKMQHNADEVVLAFVQKPEIIPRAYWKISGEICAFCQSNDVRVVLHEVLHLFGAQDFYTPYHVVEAAYDCFGKSVMFSLDTDIDPLTKYLIGWTDQLTEEAVAFLRKTQGESGGQSGAIQEPKIEIKKEKPVQSKTQDTKFTSFAQLQQAAADGDSWAQFLLGHCYERGILTPKNIRLAEKNYRACSSYDHIIAGYALAELLLDHQEAASKEAMRILQNIYQEHIWAASLYAVCAYTGTEVGENMHTALSMTISNYDRYEYFQDAAGKKNTKTVQQYQTAEKLSAGIEPLHQSIKALREQYEKTQTDGEPVLLFLMGKYLQEGVQLRQNTKRALELYTRAAEAGLSVACEAVEECYFNGIGTDKDYYEAAVWHKKAQQSKLREENDPNLSLRFKLINRI